MFRKTKYMAALSIDSGGMRARHLALGLGALCASSLLSVTAPNDALAQTVLPENTLKTCSLGSDFDQDWSKITLDLNFGIGLPITVPVGPAYDTSSGLVYIFPANGPSFQKDDDASHCKFFKWGAQMFYWATSTISDTLGNVPTGIVPPNSSTPYVFDTEFFYRVSERGADGMRHFVGQGVNEPSGPFPIRTRKATGVGQAGGDDVLISRANSLVYYGIHTSRLYGYFLTQQKNHPGPNNSHFPKDQTETCSAIKYSRDNGLSSSSEISDILFYGLCGFFTPNADEQSETVAKSVFDSLSPSETIPKIETAVDYLSMTVEMKTSWVDAATVGSKSDYVTQVHEVPLYNKLTADIWEPAGTISKELALVGMHIVGSVEGHPEMIWATIEHRNNAPNVAYPYLNASNHLTYGADVDGRGDWLFWDPKGTTTTLQTLKPSAKLADQGRIVSEPGANITPVNVKRFHPWGGPVYDSNTDIITPEMLATAKNNSDLISLNQDVIKRITEFYASKDMAVTDPRLNYFISGATWTADGSIPSFESTDTEITGSTVLANTTLETFHQTDNCFSCHSSSSTGKTPPGLSISHIYGSIEKLPIKGQ